MTIEQSMNLHFYLNLIASNPYLVKLSASQQQTLTKVLKKNRISRPHLNKILGFPVSTTFFHGSFNPFGDFWKGLATIDL